MNIVLIEPYFTGSHKNWAVGLQKHSSHTIELLTLPGSFWKWRMHGGAVTLARMFMESGLSPDLILATDMLDVSTFLSLTRTNTGNIPVALYFHENQLSYPWSPTDRDVQTKRDIHYGFINYISALSSDIVLFNSHYHMDSFLNEIPVMLKSFPDHNELDSIHKIKDKSKVLYLGLDLNRFDKYKTKQKNSIPIILWNHRWEYDKNPEDFFHVLEVLANKNLDFKIVILGENFKEKPEIFLKSKKKFEEQIIHFGYAKSFTEYAKWLWKADILPVTSHHDFFGSSIMEAIYCGVFPILPKRLSYPELIPKKSHGEIFYKNSNELVKNIESIMSNKHIIDRKELQKISSKYDWRNIVKLYDDIFEDIIR